MKELEATSHNKLHMGPRLPPTVFFFLSFFLSLFLLSSNFSLGRGRAGRHLLLLLLLLLMMMMMMMGLSLLLLLLLLPPGSKIKKNERTNVGEKEKEIRPSFFLAGSSSIIAIARCTHM